MNVAPQLKKIPFAKFPPPQSMLITLSGTTVISCLVDIVQGGGGEVLPRFGMLENSPKTVKCVITFETDCRCCTVFIRIGAASLIKFSVIRVRRLF